MRIQKYLSEKGLCSRRQAEAFIEQGLVSVNGKVVRTQGVQIDPARDVVTLAPSASQKLDATETIAVYKPRGVTSSRVPEEGKSIFDVLPQYKHLNVVGRLDKESEGLLILSNDGPLARAITGDEHRTEKEYIVTVREHVGEAKLATLEPGVELEDGPTLPVTTKREGSHSFRIVLREGRNHQIRRMCNFLHLTVESLKRVRVGSVTLKGLQPGTHRELSREEVLSLCSTEGQQAHEITKDRRAPQGMNSKKLAPRKRGQ